MKVHRFAGVSFAVLCALALPTMAQAQTPFNTISSSGPIENIDLGDELSCQVDLVGDTTFTFFPSGTRPGDCGTFLTVGTDEFGGDFSNHGGSAFDPGNGMTYAPFTPVSQTTPSGNGTSGNPFTVTTVVDAGSLRVTQVDSYVTGNKFYETQVTVTNNGSSTVDAELYRAGDCYLAGSDSGFGFEIPSTGSIFCAENANNTPAGRLIGFQPRSGGSTYLQDNYNTVWEEIDSDLFSNTCVQCPNDVDNGIGISWTLSIPAGSSTTRSLITSIDPTGDVDAPETTITSGPADGSTSSDPTPTFGFTSDEAGSTFECSVDGGPFTPCSSGDTFGPLADGAHAFQVRATDPAGNTDPTPASRSFTVDSYVPEPDGTCRGEAATVVGSPNADVLTGTPGDDVIAAGAGNDQIDAGGGDDLICTDDGDDVLAPGDGDDDAFGDAGNDNLSGGAGRDDLSGAAGNDTISGGDDNDNIGGDDGNDNLGGGGGNDNVGGSTGDDTVGGGSGNDNINGSGGVDDLGGGGGNDNIGAGPGADTIGGDAGSDIISADGGDDSVVGSGGEDQIGGGNGADTLAGSNGDDTLLGGSAIDTLLGGVGDDFLHGGTGPDTCQGGSGTNELLSC